MNPTKLSLLVLTILCLTLPTLIANAALPDGLAGFRGTLRGTIVSKTDNSLILKVEKIGPTWKDNKATNADAAIGQQLTITISPDRVRLIKALAERQVGDLIDVGQNSEGDALAGIELLKKVEAPTTAPAPTAKEVTRLRNRVAELEKQVADLKAQLAKLQNP